MTSIDSLFNRISVRVWVFMVAGCVFLASGLTGLIFIGQTAGWINNQTAQWLAWIGLLGLAFELWVWTLMTRFKDHDGDLAQIGSALAEKEIPILTSAITDLTQGDFTRRLSLETNLMNESSGGQTVLRQLMNRVLNGISACFRSYNWITDEPCERLLYVGTDSFQEGQMAGEIMGQITAGSGKIMIIGYMAQDNIKLRMGGFRNKLTEKYPGMQVVRMLSSSGLSNEEVIRDIQNCLAAYPDLVGCYGADSISASLLSDYIESMHQRGKIKVVSHDLSDDLAKRIEQGFFNANVSQNPFAQGYDPVIHLFNHLTAGWQPPAERLLIHPQMVSKQNLNQFWVVGRGAVQSAEMLNERPQVLAPKAVPARLALPGQPQLVARQHPR
ncbi:MAG: substrate-binding domain-containing protein, partial [Anaerolineae bacterium]|nr:substrate-binding domain-containing protein [Anaerolineae bacterium]